MSLQHRTDYAANAVLAFGLVPGIVGINTLIRPAHALSLLGFPSPPEPQGRKLAHSLVRMSAARNLTMTLTTLAVWLTADRVTLGWTLLASVPIAVIDGFISKAQVDGMEWGHWFAVPISLGLGAHLIGWI